MKSSQALRWLLLETSGRVGQVALAQGEQVLARRLLAESRRHARDLAPAVRDLLAAFAWSPQELDAIAVSRGPGSYTGLRVGILSAKTLAYATGCALLAVETFAVIAAAAPPQVRRLDVLADAQQERVYVQRFQRSAEGAPLEAATPLRIVSLTEWLATAAGTPELAVSGPALAQWAARLPAGLQLLPPSYWEPQPEYLLALASARYQRGERDDLWTVEPLYLRPSAAEEQWTKKCR